MRRRVEASGRTDLGIAEVALEVVDSLGNVRRGALRQVVDDPHLFSSREQVPDDCAPDEPGSSGHELHGSSPTPKVVTVIPACANLARSRVPQQSTATRGSAIRATDL